MKDGEKGSVHLEEAWKAEKAGDHVTARMEYYKSVVAFTGADTSDTPPLTPREQEVFSMLLEGTSPKEIAAALRVSYDTVHFHQKNLYRKLGVQSRTELFTRYSNLADRKPT